MSAIEMMDPKMDAGKIGNQVNRKVLNFEPVIKDGIIKIKDPTLPELIGIMDTCFCCLEDFQSMTYGFKMASSVTNLRGTGILKDVEDDMQRRVKSTQSRQGEESDPEVELEVIELIFW